MSNHGPRVHAMNYYGDLQYPEAAGVSACAPYNPNASVCRIPTPLTDDENREDDQP